MSSKNFECIEHVVPSQHIRHHARATSTTQEEELHLAVKQYKPRYETKPGDVTILAAGALGCPKEMYEPLWDAIFEYTQRPECGYRVRGILIADPVNHGESAALNDRKLGSEPSFWDFARDYLAIVNHFRKDMPLPIVGFGHSLGGTILLNLALMHPRLLTSMVLIEPSLYPSSERSNFSVVLPMTLRRDLWPSRDAALEATMKNPLYKRWDPEAAALFRRWGLKELPTTVYPSPTPDQKDSVTLTTTKYQEAFTYALPAYPTDKDGDLINFDPPLSTHPDQKGVRNPKSPVYRPEPIRTHAMLPHVRPSCLYMYGSETHLTDLCSPENRREKLELTGTAIGGSGGAKEGRVREVVISGGSHHVPLDLPIEVGRLTAAYFDEEIQRFRREESQLISEMETVPHAKRSVASEDWKFWLHKAYGRGPRHKRGDKPKPNL